MRQHTQARRPSAGSAGSTGNPAQQPPDQLDARQATTLTPVEARPPSLLALAAAEVLPVTYWFEPLPEPQPYPLTIRFTGRRVGVAGTPELGDAFLVDEMIADVVPGSGPIAITTRVHGINPGEWSVEAQQISPTQPTHSKHLTRRERRLRAQEHATASAAADAATAATTSFGPLTHFWRRWTNSVGPAAESAESDAHLHTCLYPLARVPGVVPGSWAALVTLGVIVALTTQSILAARDHLAVSRLWPVWLIALAVGIAGAKAWFVVLYRAEHKREGWCIQGFIMGATVMAAILLVALRLPADAFLDSLAPGLLFGMAVGRVGCFFAGCCGGPPTAARWGVWSSDQRVGARRVPTQLMESALALSLGFIALIVVLAHGVADGVLFVAALAAYTLGRQGILHLRAERRKTRYGGMITAVAAALLLVASIVYIIAFA